MARKGPLVATIKTKITRHRVKEWKEHIKSETSVQQRQATRVWLREALSHIPVYTGTSRGTFKPLSRVLRVANEVGSIEPAAKAKKFFIYKGIKYPLGFERGGKYSTYKFNKHITKDVITNSLVFKVALLYLLWNELQPGPSWFPFRIQPPYDAIKKANEAYEEYVINDMPKRFHKLSRYAKVITNRVG